MRRSRGGVSPWWGTGVKPLLRPAGHAPRAFRESSGFEKQLTQPQKCRPPSPSLTHKSAYLAANRYLFIHIYTHIHPIFWQRTNASIVDFWWIKYAQKGKSAGFGTKFHPQPNLSTTCAFVDNSFTPQNRKQSQPKIPRILAKKYASYARRGGRNPASAGRIYRGMRFSPQGCG